jgi:hypothetical protein
MFGITILDDKSQMFSATAYNFLPFGLRNIVHEKHISQQIPDYYPTLKLA